MHTCARTVVRSDSAGLFMFALGDYLAWLPLTFHKRLRGKGLHRLPTSLGRCCYRSGFVAQCFAEGPPPFQEFESMVREAALVSQG